MLFILTGDILHPGQIEVKADNLDEALDAANDGNFVVRDEENKHLAFVWCGDDPEIVEDEGQCRRCGSNLNGKGRCSDVTCPYSDRDQATEWTED